MRTIALMMMFAVGCVATPGESTTTQPVVCQNCDPTDDGGGDAIPWTDPSARPTSDASWNAALGDATLANPADPLDRRPCSQSSTGIACCSFAGKIVSGQTKFFGYCCALSIRYGGIAPQFGCVSETRATF